MESNNGEAGDDQGSGWLEVKKKHRSSSKFSVQSWVGGFSGKNGSYQITQASTGERNGNLRGKRVSHHSKGGANLSTHGCGNVTNSASVSNEDENNVFFPDKSVVTHDHKDSRHSMQSPASIADSNAGVGDSQNILLKHKPDILPKIRWGDLEDDVLIQHCENKSRADTQFVDKGDNNLEARKPENNCHLVPQVSSRANVQQNKLVVKPTKVDISSDQSSSLTKKESIIGKNCKELSEISSENMEVPSADGEMIASNDALNFKEGYTENLKPTGDDYLSSVHPSSEEAGLVEKVKVPAVVSEVHELKISELPVTSVNLMVIPSDSESFSSEKNGPQISEEAGIVVKLQFPVVPATNESKFSEFPVGNGTSGTLVIPQASELLLPEDTNPEISSESGIVVKLQLPVISEANEPQKADASVTNSNSNATGITHDKVLHASGQHVPEISGESSVTASVEDSGAPLDVTLPDELSEVQNTISLGEGDGGESKERFRERLWCFLFENLNRAVDELYLLCELECDVEQMKEAILVLEEAASDFKELVSRVQEFENIKRSSPRSFDGPPITLKSDHRRPHALSWEVRRMTTSPHRAEILSSSLEAFNKIQQERANMLAANDAKTLRLACSDHNRGYVDELKKPAGKSDVAPNVKDSTKARKQSRGSDSTQASLNIEKRNIDFGKLNKVNFVQNGLDPPHNASTSNDSSILPSMASSASGYEKGKKEAEANVLPHEKDKTLTETSTDKSLRSTESTIKKQIPPSERDRERRNSTSWKSMDAWKEKRNWEDILSSPFRVSSRISHSPGMSRKSAERARILHDKLMSPEKKKKKKTALDLKREAEEKHARALRIRSELENERVQKLQRTSEKLNRVNEWQAVRTMKLREGMYARHQRSESRHEAFLAQVVRRAGDESSKVNEVRFITSLNEENKKLMLRQKLHDSELRRAEKLQVIKTKQKEDMAREEAVLERRKLIEAEKLQRLAETQRKKEEAQVRREEERKASSAAREARAIEQLRRREERAKAQQEEAELLAQKLAERLSESEQRRKFYLEQIRERASMDFRDQSSPLMRRQGRTTPINSGEDYPENSAAGAGSSTLATGSATLQHSLKRRIKKIRQRLMALKYEFTEPPVGPENSGITCRMAVGTARAKFGRWLQELQRLRQARKEGAASIGLITAEMIKYLEGKDLELQASRQAGLLDFISSALPASHTSKPEACQVTIHLLKLLRVVLSIPANRSYFLSQNLLPPIIPMLSTALENYIKIAASLNVPGTANLPSSKTSVESFESASEVLDNFLWTVGTVVGHTSSDDRELQMRDGLLELLIAYQVIHRLRDLFALYDRPQAEGSPLPSSILLSIHLLVALTYRPGTGSSINWESSSVETVVRFENQEHKEISDFGRSVNMTSEDNRAPLSVLNGSTVIFSQDGSEDRHFDESFTIDKSDESVASISNNGEKKPYGSVESDMANASTRDGQNDSQKIQIEKDVKHMVYDSSEKKNDYTLNMKQPVAFLLSAVSETGLVSLPSLLTAVLLQANNRLSSDQGLYILPSNFEEVATGALKVLNNLSLLDITFMQRILARPDLKMEFFHLMSFLLSHCTSKWKVPTDQVGMLLIECLLLLGHFALFHPQNQAVLRWGKGPTILHKVCDLPFVFFSDPELMPILAGTLVAACYGCELNKEVVQQELSMDMLLSLLRSCRHAPPAIRSNPIIENLRTEASSENNQPSCELKKSLGDAPQRSSRTNSKSTRVSLGKGGSLGISSRCGKIRSQRDCRISKISEEISLKHNTVAPETCMMLHYRFPGSFMDRAEQFFSSAGITKVGDEA